MGFDQEAAAVMMSRIAVFRYVSSYRFLFTKRISEIFFENLAYHDAQTSSILHTHFSNLKYRFLLIKISGIVMSCLV